VIARLQVLQNSDELFEREELSAAPDIGWPDMFNSGVFVYRPSVETYRALLALALSEGSFDGQSLTILVCSCPTRCGSHYIPHLVQFVVFSGGDQGLLNTYFSDWREKEASFRLPFIYNMSSGAIYTYAAAYKRCVVRAANRPNANYCVF
jgi:glycogenin glucosyltransferase